MAKAGPQPVPASAVADRGIADGTLFVVEDVERNPMGIVTASRIFDGARLGWHLASRALGKGLGSILAEGITLINKDMSTKPL